MDKMLPLILLFSCFGFLASAQQSYEPINEAPLVEVIQLLESKNDIIFSYDNDRVTNQLINLEAGTYTLHEILKKVLPPSKT